MKEMETQSKPSLKLQAYQYLKTKILNCEYDPFGGGDLLVYLCYLLPANKTFLL